jgi:hypothetical protein
VLVLQVFVRKNLAWLWLAIGAHALVDLVAVAVPQLAGVSLSTMLLSELIVAAWGVIALIIVWKLRDRTPLSSTAASGPVRRPTGAVGPR